MKKQYVVILIVIAVILVGALSCHLAGSALGGMDMSSIHGGW
jgi:hypothetical protein